MRLASGAGGLRPPATPPRVRLAVLWLSVGLVAQPALAAAPDGAAGFAAAGPVATSVAAATDPVVTLRWSGGQVRVDVRAPEGEHVNDAAPAALDDGRAEARGPGALDWGRLPLAADTLYRVSVPLCTDDGRACRTVTVAGRTPEKPRGRGAMALGGADVASGDAVTALPGRVADGAPVRGVRVYDFFGVWCPPCNQLRAEVLDDPADAAALAGIEVVPIDADRPESWALKSRFAVKGYPTLVAVDTEGLELDRLVGFPGNDETLAWFAGLTERTPLAVLESGPSAGVAGDEAARSALRLVRAERQDAARRWLAAAAGDSVELHWARLLLQPSAADADWMLANAPDGDWLYDVLASWPDRWPQVAPRLPGMGPELTAAALQAYAGSAPADAALAARVGAAALIEARMEADPGGGKGHVTELADALASIGRLDRALALLDDFAARHPDEFTYDFVASRLLLDAGRHADAELRARAALALAWGDQRLRTVQRLARALDGQGRRSEAVAVLRTELAAAPRPSDDVQVRTTRYLGEVESLLSELQAPR